MIFCPLCQSLPDQNVSVDSLNHHWGSCVCGRFKASEHSLMLTSCPGPLGPDTLAVVMMFPNGSFGWREPARGGSWQAAEDERAEEALDIVLLRTIVGKVMSS